LIWLILLGLIIAINVAFWWIKESRRWVFGVCVYDVRAECHLALEGSDSRELCIDFRFYPAKYGYVAFDLCLGIITLALSLHWGDYSKLDPV
jgi:hypothetical protein